MKQALFSEAFVADTHDALQGTVGLGSQKQCSVVLQEVADGGVQLWFVVLRKPGVVVGEHRKH